mmetsp:Transcript_101841/g.296956  ORF Transcript_101841/g.296956 Transcript_101841/m.296956 type:complete len:85 (-) Transcript_101841:2-256(-)
MPGKAPGEALEEAAEEEDASVPDEAEVEAEAREADAWDGLPIKRLLLEARPCWPLLSAGCFEPPMRRRSMAWLATPRLRCCLQA